MTGRIVSARQDPSARGGRGGTGVSGGSSGRRLDANPADPAALHRGRRRAAAAGNSVGLSGPPQRRRQRSVSDISRAQRPGERRRNSTTGPSGRRWWGRGRRQADQQRESGCGDKGGQAAAEAQHEHGEGPFPENSPLRFCGTRPVASTACQRTGVREAKEGGGGGGAR
jgi:hypothetical protein